MRNFILTLIFIIGLVSSSITSVYATQNIQIVGGNAQGLPIIALIVQSHSSSPNQSSLPDNQVSNVQYISSIIADDLKITGEFNIKEYDSVADVESRAKYLITTNIDNKNSQFTAILKHNNAESVPLLTTSLSFTSANLRSTAHTISNTIYKKLTNTPGIFTSKIAYIVHNGHQYEIIIADYDGHNQKIILVTHAPLMSLRWSHNDRQIAYVSFELNKPVVYVQDLYHATRYIVANFSGSNSSPVFTPDDKMLAVTLTKDYGSHIFLVANTQFNRKTTHATSVIRFGEIDTEADINKNNTVVFTSDHDGGPQIFMTHLQPNNSITTPVRLTVNLGQYNTSARLAHDGSKITFVNRTEGVLRAFVMNLASKITYPVSLNTNLDMAPNFSPNDKLILFSSDSGMYIVNTTGSTQTKLGAITGDILDEQWGNTF